VRAPGLKLTDPTVIKTSALRKEGPTNLASKKGGLKGPRCYAGRAIHKDHGAILVGGGENTRKEGRGCQYEVGRPEKTSDSMGGGASALGEEFQAPIAR